jgi:4-hydroxybenzoyl-CoA thioesterase
MSYSRTIQIEFNHCDPAGIVFYPRYFEMTNSVVENFFREELHYSYARMSLEEGRGVPTVKIDAQFHAPSRLGDLVEFTLQVRKVGRTSVQFRIRGAMAGEARMSADLTLVWVDAKGRPDPWPASVRERLEWHCNQGGGDE